MPCHMRNTMILLPVLAAYFGCQANISVETPQQTHQAVESSINDFPPKTLQDTLFPVRAGRTLQAQNRLPGSYKNPWPLAVNKGLVVAVASHADLFTIGGDVATLLNGFSLSLYSGNFYTAFEDSNQFAQVVYQLQGPPDFRTLQSVFVGSSGYLMKFDAQGTLWAYRAESNAHVPVNLGQLESSDYDWLSKGDTAKEFLVDSTPYVWRFLFKPESSIPIGVLVTPKGGKRNGETELGFLDFQSSAGSLLNPIEHYLGTRTGSFSRVDHTLVTPDGVNLRAMSSSGAQQRVFYRGLFKNFLINERMEKLGTINTSMAVFDGENEMQDPVVRPDAMWTYGQ